VFDYGITLKLNDGPHLVKQLFMMLKLHLCLDMKSRGGAYSQSIVVQLLIVLYQKKQSLPSWVMLQSQPTLFNEEAGEMTFSQLARACVGDTQQRKFQHMDRLYKLLYIYGDVEIDTLADVRAGAKDACSRKKVNPEGEEVEAVAAFMLMKIRELRHQKVTAYDGTEASYKNRMHALANLKPLRERKPFMDGDMMSVFMLNIKKAQSKFMHTDWAGTYSDIWPGCKIPTDGVEGVDVFASHPELQDIGDGQVCVEDDEDFVPESENKDMEDMDERHVSTGCLLGAKNKGEDPDEFASLSNQVKECDSSQYSSSDEESVLAPPPTSAGRQIAPIYCSLDSSNITMQSRHERRGRGSARPDANFPIVHTSTPKRRKK
jgi:hypothetical protein